MRKHTNPARIITPDRPTRKTFRDRVGNRYGRLVVTGYVGQKTFSCGVKTYYWNCVCDCGNTVVASFLNLRSGSSNSCGCLKRELCKARYTEHGMKHTAEYRAWSALRTRCTNTNLPDYARYGGRGVTFCERWKSFQNFYADVGPRPSPLHSIDRWPNKDGNYEPGNVRWATDKEQARNTRNNRTITFAGFTFCAAEWAERLGMGVFTLYRRLNAGWSVEDALKRPVRQWGKPQRDHWTATFGT